MRTTTDLERQRAIQRGLDFIYRTARNRRHFREYGSDLLWCFYLISSTSKPRWLRRMAREMGRERARQWRHDYSSLPPDSDADTIVDFIYGSAAADKLGIPDKALKRQLRQSVGRFTAADYFGFDPTNELPPTDLTEQCDCGMNNERGRKFCRKCRRRLEQMSRYRVWYYALMRAYSSECFGIRLAASYSDVIKLLPVMRPYDNNDNGRNPDFYDTVYAVTHIIYTLNAYSAYKLSPRWLPQEFRFLKENLKEAIEMQDPEMVGEFLDSLKSFGLTESHPLIRLGVNYLLSQQNSDGSWGEIETDDIYQRYHPTWTAIDGLRDYAWRYERLSFPKLKPLLKQWAKG